PWLDVSVGAWVAASTSVAVLLLLQIRLYRFVPVALLLLLPVFFPAAVRPTYGAARLLVFDVGQGLSVLVQTQHHTLLYDTGPGYASGFNTGEAVIVPYLRYSGIRTVDKLVLSHGDMDHRGGVDAVLESLDVTELVTNVPVPGRETTPCLAGTSWVWDAVSFNIIHPISPSDYADGNNTSCVLTISTQGATAMLPGDIEWQAELQLALRTANTELGQDPLAADVLIMPHHGSKTSSSPGFLDRVNPAVAIASVGYLNRFHHPYTDVVDRYQSRGVTLLTTALLGSIVVDLGVKGELELDNWRMQHRYYWN
ncbi:MAG: competence protein ComEC, partial [Halieaceae bacterium]